MVYGPTDITSRRRVTIMRTREREKESKMWGVLKIDVRDVNTHTNTRTYSLMYLGVADEIQK